jgi:signal transduction histidine kinase
MGALLTGDQPRGVGALRPRARLIRTLGVELISSEKVALTELVKNSYDADATVVVVRFNGPLLRGQGSVEVWDDGFGMDVKTLQNSWLDIATDFKRRRTRSPSGARRVLGEKGIGRLAGARLADEMLVTTRQANAEEIQLLINWNDFDRPNAYLDEIEVAWQVGPAKVFSERGGAAHIFKEAGIDRWRHGHGTLIELAGLSRDWNSSDFQELRTVLSRLVRPRPGITPVTVVEDFRVVLDLPPEYESMSGEVAPPEEISSSHYRLIGSVDELGTARLRYTQLEPPVREDFTGRLWVNSDRRPESGPFDFDLQVFDRDRDSLAQVAGKHTYTDFRQILDQVSGVSVYRDGFRVLPFGEAGDDWLALDRRRVQNPSLRVSNNQVIGHIFISADVNTALRDQSNREGLINSTAYADLIAMMRAALALVETRRFAVRRRLQTPERTRRGLFKRFDLTEIQSALTAMYPHDKRLRDLVAEKDQDIQQGVEEVQSVLAQYSRLATLGSLVDRVVHDGRTAVTRLKNIVRFGQRDLAKQTLSSEEKLVHAKSYLDETDVQADLLATLFRQITPFSGRRRGRPRVESLRNMVDDGISMLSSEIVEVGADVEIVGSGIDIRADPSEILNVVVNLVRNSLYWLSTLPKEKPREIVISLNRKADQSVEITVSDSGPGVPEAFRDEIFDAYFSLKPDGVGLGLTIAGNIITEFYDGSLRLVEDGPLPGATFTASLRKRV